MTTEYKQLDTRNVPTDPYNAQCIMGHVTSIRPGSELEGRAKKREAEGKLDAIIVNEDECWKCETGKEDAAYRAERICGLVGCLLMDESCKKGCVYAVAFR